MYESSFTPVDPAVASAETQRRQTIIEWFAYAIQPAVSGMIVTGSMAYGRNYSVKTTSDIDIQLPTSRTLAAALPGFHLFDESELRTALAGYQAGAFQQFSLTLTYEGVTLECHFWDEQALMDAITMQTSVTKRLRGDITKPSTDHAFAFDGEENTKDYYGEALQGYFVGDFPSYRTVNNKTYFCRPVTNALSVPYVVLENANISNAIEQCWRTVVGALADFKRSNPTTAATASIANIFPHRNKLAPDVLQAVTAKTQTLLDTMQQSGH